MTTQIVSFKDVQEHWDARRGRFDSPEFVYIGRANRAYHLPNSIWGNPYPVKLNKGESEPSARTRSINAYREYLRHKPELLAQVRGLRGKTLVCWCKDSDHPHRQCHGDVLLEMLGEDRAEAAPGIAQVDMGGELQLVLAWDGGFASHQIGMDRRGILYRTEDVIAHPIGEPGKVYERWADWYRDYLKMTLRVKYGAVCSGMSQTEYARFRYEQGLIAREGNTDERALIECEILQELLDELGEA